MITFKSVSALDQWHDLHPKLREVLLDIHDNVWPRGAEFTITRIADYDSNQKTAIHTSGPPHRATDLRTIGVPSPTLIEQRINERWKYGDPANPGRNVALFHTGSAEHMHIQVRLNGTYFYPVKEA